MSSCPSLLFGGREQTMSDTAWAFYWGVIMGAVLVGAVDLWLTWRALRRLRGADDER